MMMKGSPVGKSKHRHVQSPAKKNDYDKPIDSWSMQDGGAIFLRQGQNEIMIDPFDLREILYQHTTEDYFSEVDTDDGECTAPHEGWWCSRPRWHDGPCAARRKKS